MEEGLYATDKKGARRAKPIEATLDVTYVSGPAAASLARTQYEAIWEVLSWLHEHRQSVDSTDDSR